MHRLTQEQVKRLCMRPIFLDLVKAAMFTGCRYGQLCAVRATDADGASGTFLMLNPHSETRAAYRSRKKARRFSA
jgi:hypothetical protein